MSYMYRGPSWSILSTNPESREGTGGSYLSASGSAASMRSAFCPTQIPKTAWGSNDGADARPEIVCKPSTPIEFCGCDTLSVAATFPSYLSTAVRDALTESIVGVWTLVEGEGIPENNGRPVFGKGSNRLYFLRPLVTGKDQYGRNIIGNNKWVFSGELSADSPDSVMIAESTQYNTLCPTDEFYDGDWKFRMYETELHDFETFSIACDSSPSPPPPLPPLPPPSPPPPAPPPTEQVTASFVASGDVADYTVMRRTPSQSLRPTPYIPAPPASLVPPRMLIACDCVPAVVLLLQVEKRDSIREVIASEAGVDLSAVEVVVSAASVRITVTITLTAADGESGADITASATSKADTLAAGIFASTSALSTALTAAGIEDVQLETIDKSPALPCSQPCLANPSQTCADTKALPCTWVQRLGCDCHACCDYQSSHNSNPPELCGTGLVWDGTRCEINCAAP